MESASAEQRDANAAPSCQPPSVACKAPSADALAEGNESNEMPSRPRKHSHARESSPMDDELVTLDSKINFDRPQTHQLPFHIMWGITALIGAGVAIANFSIAWVVLFLTRAKFSIMQVVTDTAGISAGIVALTVFCMLIGAVAGGLVALCSPVCAGGGLPEMRSFLNGNSGQGFFSVRTLVVRYLGTILAVGTGYPIGREGPTISIGCTLGVGVTKLLAMPYVQRRVNLGSDQGGSMGRLPATMIDEERLTHAKRIGCAMGGAAGMATIFNAPIGGLLYMLEEVTVTNWDNELTFRAFVCTVGSCIFSRALLNLCGANVEYFLIHTVHSQYAWSWEDIPFFMVLAAILGASSGLYARLMIIVFSRRKRCMARVKQCTTGVKILDCSIYAGICAFGFSLISLAARCQHDRVQREDVEFLRFNCPEGMHNPIASLVIQGPEEAIKMAYSPTGIDMELYELGLSLGMYTLLNLGMNGLSVPIGTFIPTMLMGSFAGRAYGIGLWKLSIRGLPQRGIFSLVGSAAMLGGFTHQTLAVVVLLIECVSNFELISPLMVTIFVAHIMSKLVNPEGYNEQIIVEKDVPYLDPELPEEVEDILAEATAADLCYRVDACARLPPEASVEDVQRALKQSSTSNFPVLGEEGSLLGIITRRRLQAALDAYTGATQLSPGNVTTNGTPASNEAQPEEADLENGSSLLPLYRIMDRAPFTVPEKTPAPRLYPQFARTNAEVVCVTAESGAFMGLLCRNSLISAARHKDFRNELSVWRGNTSRTHMAGIPSVWTGRTSPSSTGPQRHTGS